MGEEKNRVAGFEATEARHAARRNLGNTTALKESTRQMWTFTSLETFWRDIRFGARVLIKEPGFTFVVVFMLALGVGANTAIFSIVNGLMLRPLSVSDPATLAYLAFPRGPDSFDA